MSWKVEVSRHEKVFRTRHFITKKRAEKYVEEQETRNPMGSLMDFEIIEVKE